MNSTLLSSYLLAALIVIPLVAIPLHCGYRRIQVDHVATFSIGFLFYWVTPAVIGVNGFLRDRWEMNVWYNLFDEIGNRKINEFLFIALGCYCAFLAGTFVGGRTRIWAWGKLLEIHFDHRLLKGVLWGLTALVAALAIALHDRFFGEYRPVITMDDMDASLAAYMAACSILVGVLLFDCATKERLAPTRKLFRGKWPDRFFITYFIAGFLCLTMGTRLYFISGILMLCVYRSVFLRGFRPLGLLVVGVSGILLAGTVGVLRFHHQQNSIGVLFNIGVETLFTSIPLVSFLRDYRIPLVQFPHPLVSNLVTLVPTFIMPHKWDLMVSFEDVGYRIFAPLGAMNSFVSFMINFGALGTITGLFFLGAAMARLKAEAQSPLAKVIYTMVTGWFALTFFRDPFYISLIKSILEFSILVPVALTIALHIFTRLRVFRPTMRAAVPQPQYE